MSELSGKDYEILNFIGAVKRKSFPPSVRGNMRSCRVKLHRDNPRKIEKA